jgi:RimJ/RimL family protein N-acetyltransferase
MANDHWPLFDLAVETPQVTLRSLDDALAQRVVAVAARGIHDSATTPFSIPWTDLPSPQMEHEAMRFYWRTRADISPDSWTLQFAVLADDEVIGACDLTADGFAQLRQVTTGSWIGREFQGRGLGTSLRRAALGLAFDGLGAMFAVTTAWHDNAASLGVTRSLGYEQVGRRQALRRGEPDEQIEFRMTRAHWMTIRDNNLTLHGLDESRIFLGL